MTLPDQADEAVGLKIREAAGLLIPSQIQDNRLRLGYSQKDFADRLGVAEATFQRWESNGQIHQKAFDRTLRAIFRSPIVRSVYEEVRLEAHKSLRNSVNPQQAA